MILRVRAGGGFARPRLFYHWGRPMVIAQEDILDAAYWMDNGFAVLIVVAAALTAWRLGVALWRWGIQNNKTTPPTPGIFTKRLLADVKMRESMAEFFPFMKQHLTRQESLCEFHTKSMKTLIDLHTDATISGSMAEAVTTIALLRKAAIQACQLARESSDTNDITKTICDHCDRIEAILKGED